MSEHRRHRLPEPNLQELRAWRRLIRTALAMAEDPRAPAGELEAAARVARRSVAPSVDGQPISRDNPFVRLQNLAQRFVAGSAQERQGMAGELKVLAEACGGQPAGRAAREAEPAPTPRRHPGHADD